MTKNKRSARLSYTNPRHTEENTDVQDSDVLIQSINGKEYRYQDFNVIIQNIYSKKYLGVRV